MPKRSRSRPRRQHNRRCTRRRCCTCSQCALEACGTRSSLRLLTRIRTTPPSSFLQGTWAMPRAPAAPYDLEQVFAAEDVRDRRVVEDGGDGVGDDWRDGENL